MKTNEGNCKTCNNQNCLIKKNIELLTPSDFIASKRTIVCRKSQSFILEDSPVHGLYFIYDGKAKVYSRGFQGKDQIIRFAGNGDIVGHRGLLTFESYRVSATAVEDTTLCYFSSETLMEMLHSVANLTFDLMKFYAEELQRSEDKVKKFSQMNVRERVIDALMYIINKFGTTDGVINFKVSRREIADFAGTTEDQATRVLSKLNQEGLIHLEKKSIQIVNMIKLLEELD